MPDDRAVRGTPVWILVILQLRHCTYSAVEFQPGIGTIVWAVRASGGMDFRRPGLSASQSTASDILTAVMQPPGAHQCERQACLRTVENTQWDCMVAQPQVTLSMSKELPVVVEYRISDIGHISCAPLLDYQP